MEGVVKSLEEASTKLLKWFSDNLMKLTSVIYKLAQTTRPI